MRAPLNTMVIRTAELDELARSQRASAVLSPARSPLGGTFGKVRSSGARPHQGWDLYARVGTPAYAIAGGVVAGVRAGDGLEGYGTQVCIELDAQVALSFRQPVLFAFYGHLASAKVSPGQKVKEGDLVGYTGNSGNAFNTPAHLHFETRTVAWPGKGLRGRIDPGAVLGFKYYSCSEQDWLAVL